MVRSMTGFGSSARHIGGIELSATVRSLNGRYLDVRLSLPREHLGLESEVKKWVREAGFTRGSIEVLLSRRSLPGAQTDSLALNTEALRQWKKIFSQAARELGLKDPPSLTWLLNQQGVVTPVEGPTEAETTREHRGVKMVLQAALRSCQQARRREGEALAKHVREILRELVRLVSRFRELAGVSQDRLRERWERKAVNLREEWQVDSLRLAQEFSALLERADVMEEIERLSAHLAGCEKLLHQPEPKGKKLDFYCQEILRELNTLGSKSQWVDLTEGVLEGKVLLERLREQVQNME